jgi:hypothetical protein
VADAVLETLHARYRNAYKTYYEIMVRVDEELDRGSLPSAEELDAESQAPLELSVARQE